MRINALRAALPLAATLLFSASSHARPQTADSAAARPAIGLGPVEIKDTSIVEIDTTHLRIAVAMTITPSRSVTLENLRLTQLHLNGLPVYAEPLTEPIELVQGKETALPPVYVTIQVRDLTTTAPLREIIEKQSAHVQGQMVADIKMNFLDKLALHTEHPHVSLAILQDVPVAFGSTPFAREAALGALTLIDLGIQGSSAVRKTIPGLESPWVHDLETQANSSLFQVKTSYLLKEHDASYPVILDQLGFRLSSGQIVTTAEAKAPWEFDSDFLSRIKSGEAKLEKNGFEVQLSHATGGTGGAPLQLTHKDFTLEERGASDNDALIVQKSQNNPQRQDEKQDFSRIELRRRASPTALTVLILQTPPPSGGFHAAPPAVVQQDSWENIALYRLVRDSASGKTSAEVIQLSAHRDGQAIHLDEPVDPTFFGSPILVPEGVLGIVQDEQAGAFLPTDLATAASSAAVVARLAANDPGSR